jgi:uncharacterized damage-inducible protein DinB
VNASDVLKYGHRTVLGSIDGMLEAWWDVPGACGVWSIKDIIAHLASYEHVLVDVLSGFVDGGPTPYLEKFKGADFNDTQVAARTAMSAREVVDEYTTTHERVMALLARISPDTLRRPGTLPWYGNEYAVDDYLVYAFYGHKREHTAQIAVMRDRLKQ